MTIEHRPNRMPHVGDWPRKHIDRVSDATMFANAGTLTGRPPIVRTESTFWTLRRGAVAAMVILLALAALALIVAR